MVQAMLVSDKSHEANIHQPPLCSWYVLVCLIVVLIFKFIVIVLESVLLIDSALAVVGLTAVTFVFACLYCIHC